MNKKTRFVRAAPMLAPEGPSPLEYGIGLGSPTKVKHLREIAPISFSGCCFMRIYLTRFRA